MVALEDPGNRVACSVREQICPCKRADNQHDDDHRYPAEHSPTNTFGRRIVSRRWVSTSRGARIGQSAAAAGTAMSGDGISDELIGVKATVA